MPSVGEVVSRRHCVPSKNPCCARLMKLFTVHGDFPLSSVRLISPRSVTMATLTSTGVVGTLPDRGGWAGLLSGAGADGYWQLAPRSLGGLNGGNRGTCDAGAVEPAAAVDVVDPVPGAALSWCAMSAATKATTAATARVGPTTRPVITIADLRFGGAAVPDLGGACRASVGG